MVAISANPILRAAEQRYLLLVVPNPPLFVEVDKGNATLRKHPVRKPRLGTIEDRHIRGDHIIGRVAGKGRVFLDRLGKFPLVSLVNFLTSSSTTKLQGETSLAAAMMSRGSLKTDSSVLLSFVFIRCPYLLGLDDRRIENLLQDLIENVNRC